MIPPKAYEAVLGHVSECKLNHHRFYIWLLNVEPTNQPIILRQPFQQKNLYGDDCTFGRVCQVHTFVIFTSFPLADLDLIHHSQCNKLHESIRCKQIYCDVPGSSVLVKTGQMCGLFLFFLIFSGAQGGLLQTPPHWHATILSHARGARSP